MATNDRLLQVVTKILQCRLDADPATAKDGSSKEFVPSALLQGLRALDAPFQAEMVEFIIAERLQHPHAFSYLVNSYVRAEGLFKMLRDSDVKDSKLISDLHVVEAMLVQYSALLLSRKDLFLTSVGSRSHIKQLVHWMNTQVGSSDPSNYLRDLVTVLEPMHIKRPRDDVKSPAGPTDVTVSALNELVKELVTALAMDAGKVYLISESYLEPLGSLQQLLAVPEAATRFVTMHEFVSSTLNGFRFETANPMGVFMRCTSLPDEPIVGERYFPKPGQMTEVERQYCTKKIQTRVDKMRDILATIWRQLLNGPPLCGPALLTWVACVLLSNNLRVRLRVPPQTVSSDAFLLNMAATLLRLWFSDLKGEDHSAALDPLYVIGESRLELTSFTKIAATADAVRQWVHGRKRKRVVPSAIDTHLITGNAATTAWRGGALRPIDPSETLLQHWLRAKHPAVVCDKCRTHDFKGVRYKCANCQDFDLCGNCEQNCYLESLGLSRASGVTFRCPFDHCPSGDLSETALREHVIERHSTDGGLFRCPICEANGSAFFASQPDFGEHMRNDHRNAHDVFTHVVIKMPRTVPFIPGRKFEKLPVFPLEAGPSRVSRSDNASLTDSAAIASVAADTQAAVSHGWQCARCHVAPIKGVAYSCANCPSYYLCSECEPLANHPVSHVFFKFRKPLLPHRGAPWNHQIALTQAQSHSAKRSQLEPQPAQQQPAVDTAMTDMGGVGKMEISRGTSPLGSPSLSPPPQPLSPLTPGDMMVSPNLPSSASGSVAGGAPAGMSSSLTLGSADRTSSRSMTSSVTLPGRPRVVSSAAAVEMGAASGRSSHGHGHGAAAGAAADHSARMDIDRTSFASASSPDVPPTAHRPRNASTDWSLDGPASPLFPTASPVGGAGHMPAGAGAAAPASATGPRDDVRAVFGALPARSSQYSLLDVVDRPPPRTADQDHFALEPLGMMDAQHMTGIAASPPLLASSSNLSLGAAAPGGMAAAASNSLGVGGLASANSAFDLRPFATISPVMIGTMPATIDLTGPRVSPSHAASVEDRKVQSADAARDTGAAVHELATYDSDNKMETPVLPSFYSPAMLGPRGFSLHTEWFFMTIHSLHLGMIRTCMRFQSVVAQMENEHNALKYESMVKVKLSVEAELKNPIFLQDCLAVYLQLARWLLNLIDPEQRGLPLPAEPPLDFAGLPEYFIDDMAEYMLFLARYATPALEECCAAGKLHVLLHLFTALVATPNYVRNPYLRARLVEVLCAFVDGGGKSSSGVGSTVGSSSSNGNMSPHNGNDQSSASAASPGQPGSSPVRSGGKGPNGNGLTIRSVLENDPIVVQWLTPALIRLFVDIEHTGADSQFYDKFNVRHSIAVLTRQLLTFDSHEKALRQSLPTQQDVFLRFGNAVINDLIYLLDESISKATTVVDLQRVSDDFKAAMSMSISRRQEHERNLSTAHRGLKTAAVLATHTLQLLWIFAQKEGLSQVFLRPELLERTAHAVNFYVTKLAGAPRKKFENVKHAHRLMFVPDKWLECFLDIYQSLQRSEEFVHAVVSDERCFDAKVMRQAVEYVQQMHARKRKESRPSGAASFFNQYGTGITMGASSRGSGSGARTSAAQPASSGGSGASSAGNPNTAAAAGEDAEHSGAAASDDHKAPSPPPEEAVPESSSGGKGFEQKVDQIRALIDRFERSAATLASEQEELGDIPEEFLDPILQTLMVNPVVLPTSSITMDEAVIHRHLLSDSTDPFNRKPLTREMLVPNSEMKRRIEEFKASKRRAAAQPSTANSGPAAMDTDS